MKRKPLSSLLRELPTQVGFNTLASWVLLGLSYRHAAAVETVCFRRANMNSSLTFMTVFFGLIGLCDGHDYVSFGAAEGTGGN